MKRWPEALNGLQPTSEVIENNRYEFTIDCELGSEQRDILREFLFALKENEEFLFYYEAIDREFVGKVVYSKISESKLRRVSKRILSKWSNATPESNEDSEFEISIRILARDKST